MDSEKHTDEFAVVDAREGSSGSDGATLCWRLPNRKTVVVLVALLLAVVGHRVLSGDQAWHDPDVRYNAIQLITSRGYAAEEHTVTTSDGYILRLHRIRPHVHNTASRSRPVVFLQHGFVCSSTNWLMNSRNNSLAYLLADAGYDVWMGNSRGNTYSRNHLTFGPHEHKYWDFSLDELAHIDLPAMIDYALNMTNQTQLYYIAHSQGTTIAFANMATSQGLASKIKKIYALAPINSLKHVRGVFWFMSEYKNQVLVAINGTGQGEFLLNNSLLGKFAELFCIALFRDICMKMIFLVSGPSIDNLNMTRIPVYAGHTPAGTSIKLGYHWGQTRYTGFRHYDFESESDNMEHYGQPTPPHYDLTRVSVPIVMFTGGNDWIATPTSVGDLLPQIQHVVTFHKHIPHYAHLDFLWGMDVTTEVYDIIVNDMNNKIHF